ncbi:MAG: hypothetical protein CMJ18_18730 [Phycisphaeraceae bacterium]|nr:hypothetical protein [Phycisphaeraceae bacterium]
MLVTSLLLLSVALPVTTVAGPFLHQIFGRITGEMRSLHDLNRANLYIDRMPGELTELGVDVTRIREDLIARLARNGIKIVEDPEAPVMRLQVLLTEDPQRIVFCYRLRIFQEARVIRTKEVLTVPTYDHVVFGLTDRDNAKEQARDAAAMIVDEFLVDWHRVRKK